MKSKTLAPADILDQGVPWLDLAGPVIEETTSGTAWLLTL